TSPARAASPGSSSPRPSSMIRRSCRLSRTVQHNGTDGTVTTSTQRKRDISRDTGLDCACHPPVDLGIIAHVTNVFVDAVELPLAIEGLSSQILLPNAQKHGPESASPCLRQTQFHESCSQSAAVPGLIDVKTYQLDWIFARYTIRRLIGKKLGVTDELACRL